MGRSDRSAHAPVVLAALLALPVACKKQEPHTGSASVDNGEAGAPSETAPGQQAPIGARCEAGPEACLDGQCRNYLSYEEQSNRAVGFCSRGCEAQEDCPSGFRCTQTSTEKLCLARCSEHTECLSFDAGWKCAEAQGERVCVNPLNRGGEIALRTQLVIESISFGKAAQAWRFVPGVWADVSVTLVNKGSSGPLPMGATRPIITSDSQWVEVGDTSPTGTQIRTLAGVPVGEPQQLSVTVPDPLGTGTVKVPFFIRSLTSGLSLAPTIGVVSAAGTVDVSGPVTGFGTALALVNTHNDQSTPWSFAGDPWLAEQRVYSGMGTINAMNVRPGDILGITITEPTGSSWEGPIQVVPSIGSLFPPEPIRRSKLQGGAVGHAYVRVRDTTRLDQNGSKTRLNLQVDQPWATLSSPFVDAWNGEEAVDVAVTLPADPGCSRAFLTISWSNIELAHIPIVVLPDPQ